MMIKKGDRINAAIKGLIWFFLEDTTFNPIIAIAKRRIYGRSSLKRAVGVRNVPSNMGSYAFNMMNALPARGTSSVLLKTTFFGRAVLLGKENRTHRTRPITNTEQ
jgi:hypothetical protein